MTSMGGQIVRTRRGLMVRMRGGGLLPLEVVRPDLVPGRRLPMGYVADNHRFTRGPGAIAAFDAVGAVPLRGPGAAYTGIKPIVVAPPPVPPKPPKGIKLPQLATSMVGTITPTPGKYTGVKGLAVTPGMTATRGGGVPITAIADPVRSPTTPIKSSSTAYSGGGGGGGGGGGSMVDYGPDSSDPIDEIDPDAPSSEGAATASPAAPPSSGSSSRALVIAAAAAGGLWLLFGKKGH